MWTVKQEGLPGRDFDSSRPSVGYLAVALHEWCLVSCGDICSIWMLVINQCILLFYDVCYVSVILSSGCLPPAIGIIVNRCWYEVLPALTLLCHLDAESHVHFSKFIPWHPSMSIYCPPSARTIVLTCLSLVEPIINSRSPAEVCGLCQIARNFTSYHTSRSPTSYRCVYLCWKC